MKRLGEAVALTPDQRDLIGRMYPNETVHVYAVLSKAFDDAIFVEGHNPIHGVLLDRDEHSLGITKKSLESPTREGRRVMNETISDTRRWTLKRVPRDSGGMWIDYGPDVGWYRGGEQVEVCPVSELVRYRETVEYALTILEGGSRLQWSNEQARKRLRATLKGEDK